MPNGADKKLHFIPKVFDDVREEWVPFYIAPDATDTVQGDTRLSDSVSSTLDAATGMTAASPKAVKTVQDNANNKVDKTTTADQSIKSNLSSSGRITATAGFNGDLTGNVTGNVSGNAGTATKLANGRTISIKTTDSDTDNASAVFDGSSNIVIVLNKIAAGLINGVLSIDNIPQGALERLVKVTNQAARFALTANDIQKGDSVLQLDTGIMYIVMDTSKLDSEDGYQEYKAGTAASVPWTGVTGTTNAIMASDLNTSVNYAAGSEKGGAALKMVWNTL